jgi:glycerate 2-kinase
VSPFLVVCYRAALEAVDARRCVRDDLQRRPPNGEWHVVAIGKAAGAMAQGAIDALGARIAGGRVVVPRDHLPADFAGARYGIDVLTSSHPVPDARSLAAGEAVAEYVTSLPPDASLLFLVSGGASSLVEWLRPGVTLEDLQALNRWALAAAVPITELNALRRRVSRLKGGGLARLAGRRRSLALMISDVPRDDPRVIGSGLLHAGTPATAATYRVPEDLQAALDRAAPGADGEIRRIPLRIVATLRMACEAAASAARGRGLEARVSPRRLVGEAGTVARRLAASLRDLPPGTLQVWGGETTVALPPQPGRGGRNQHLALAAAIELERRHAAQAALLAAGTDGIDGATQDAGALVDAGTCMRGRDAGFDPHVSLAAADSGTFLEASGDLLHTGATLTNVGDLVLGLGRQPAQ